MPLNESERLRTLQRYAILDTEADRRFDDLTLLASHICQAPIAMVSLIDSDRQWFKSRTGMPFSETPRKSSFCGHAILQPGMFIVRDTAVDPRFARNPMVTGEPGIRFYAGMPLFASNSTHALGTLCVIDRVPRDLNPTQKKMMEALARQVEAMLELRLRLHQEQQLARTDCLTGAVNRRAFAENFDAELNRLQRYGRPFSIAYFDIDNLKGVNDKFGHDTGDAALREVSSSILDHLRRIDTLARMGGDEFAILLAESDADAALAAVNRFNEQLLEVMQHHRWPLTLSIGLVTCLKPDVTMDEVIKKADDLMYKIKKSGKNDIAQAVISAGRPQQIAESKPTLV
jgi:diguanylate cyclase (GGDEF)-like protein